MSRTLYESDILSEDSASSPHYYIMYNARVLLNNVYDRLKRMHWNANGGDIRLYEKNDAYKSTAVLLMLILFKEVYNKKGYKSDDKSYEKICDRVILSYFQRRIDLYRECRLIDLILNKPGENIKRFSNRDPTYEWWINDVDGPEKLQMLKDSVVKHSNIYLVEFMDETGYPDDQYEQEKWLTSNDKIIMFFVVLIFIGLLIVLSIFVIKPAIENKNK